MVLSTPLRRYWPPFMPNNVRQFIAALEDFLTAYIIALRLYIPQWYCRDRSPSPPPRPPPPEHQLRIYTVEGPLEVI